MKYKIVIDKQERSNPSSEKKTYEIEIEELRRKGNICDDLKITTKEAYVIRRLKLTQYYVLKELAKPIKQSINNIEIELFEGENYVYVLNETGNRLYLEYLINNEFNNTYVIKREMKAAIKEMADEINMSVNQKLTDVEGNITDLSSELSLTSEIFRTEIRKKVGKNEIISEINQSAETVRHKGRKNKFNCIRYIKFIIR